MNNLMHIFEPAQLPFPPHVSNELQSLIRGLLNLHPLSRLGASGFVPIRQHPFFAGIDWNSIEHDDDLTALRPEWITSELLEQPLTAVVVPSTDSRLQCANQWDQGSAPYRFRFSAGPGTAVETQDSAVRLFELFPLD